MYLHKELHAVHALKNLLRFRPGTAEVHVDFAAPSALSACSHPGPSSVKCWSCVMLLARGWCHWHQMEAALAPVPCWGRAQMRSQILTASKYNLRQVSCYLRHFSHWPWFVPDNLCLAALYELLFVNNLGPSSCFPCLWYASTWVLFKSPIWLKHWFPTNQVKAGGLSTQAAVVLSCRDGFGWPTQHPDLKRTKDELLCSFDYSFQFLMAISLQIISYLSFGHWSSAHSHVLLLLVPLMFPMFSSQSYLYAE